MANFKRGKAKNARAGCLLCKPHKVNGAPQARRGRVGLQRVSEWRQAIEYLYGEDHEQDSEEEHQDDR